VRLESPGTKWLVSELTGLSKWQAKTRREKNKERKKQRVTLVSIIESSSKARRKQA